jgi:hypothetical protein
MSRLREQRVAEMQLKKTYHKDLREVRNYAKHFNKVEAEELRRGVLKNITNLPLILHSLTLIKSFMSIILEILITETYENRLFP